MRKMIAGLAVLFFAFTLFVFIGCPATESGTEALVGMKPGTYQVSAQGIDNEYYKVWVSVDEYKIVGITWEEKATANTPHTGGAALLAMRERVLQYQTSEVDGVAGATLTANGFKAAVREALTLAEAPESFTRSPNYTTTNQTIQADVLIWGSGIAGLSAAVAAKTGDPAKKVYLIEKLPIIGGSTKYAAGVVYGALDNSDAEAENLANYYYERAQGYADLTLIRKFADESYETLAFLGIDPGFSMASGTAAAPRMRMSNGGNALVQYLYKRATDLGVTVWTGVEGTDLILTNGAVTGAKAKSATANYTFTVPKVIIATGGFDSDRELLGLHNPDSVSDFAESSHANVGQGIKIAVRDAGADTVFKGGKIGWVAVDATKFHESMHYYSQVVNQDGDLLNYDAPPAALAGGTNNAGKLIPVALAAGVYETHSDDYAVVHRRMLDARKAGATGFWAITNAAPDQNYEHAGLAYSVGVVPPGPGGKTADQAITELAGLTGMNAAKLKAAFMSGREVSSMGGPSSPLTAAEEVEITSWAPDENGNWFPVTSTGPNVFTATKAMPSSIGSMGGIKINADAQVLNTSGQAISGLYAAGECANGDFFYLEYPASGTSLAIGATFGRIAGANAVQ
jgi:fumarate reductase flavoprotein subunit